MKDENADCQEIGQSGTETIRMIRHRLKGGMAKVLVVFIESQSRADRMSDVEKVNSWQLFMCRRGKEQKK